jgi:hypothetical protein
MPAPPSPDRYLAAGAAPARRELFRSYTCLACGARHASWAAFRAHRAACGAIGPRAAPGGAAGAEAPQEVVRPAAGAPESGLESTA